MTTTMRRTSLIAIVAVLIALVAVADRAANAGHANPVLAAELDGRSEVADRNDSRIVGDPDGRGEIYVFGVDGDPDRNTLCYVLLVDKISELGAAPGNPYMAHIHEGQPGENGPVVVTLAWPQNGQSADCISVGDARITGTTPAEIFANPGDYYINVHNAEYPGGAVRGQLGSR
ncbi:MAG: CHRD domain-containing protein [Acidimicrobiia bacterium]|nr:CHRD domain-containing protein [Acidimicrobiia bacterium]